ncbi:cytoplasmic membrane protein [Plesiocystis pacifica SIR-1]|uniref:Cytoplasmic membrane protein n=1 Tax=Plesiocystis pacifica SIR-1 TaxID=391625 RepID=A6GG59_9BACT|nr:FG-GAP-like repeat-containing protein [Plesiocystis pacifica]EDM75128.1 cytoplasmic membrane protein [Plesiocystis pacifica SIR-1]
MNTPKLPLSAFLLVSSLAALIALPSTGAAAPNRDIDGDGLDDLVVGIPRDNDDDDANTGSAAVYLSSAAGFDPMELLVPRVHGGERAGFSVALGDFNCDTIPDVAMGAPLDQVYNFEEAGRVFIYSSTPDAEAPEGWSYTRSSLIRSDFYAPEEAGDRFGRSVVAADFDGDGCDDLAIGAPGASEQGTTDNTGLAYIARGTAGGLTWWQNIRPDVAGGEDARFGFSLGRGDMNEDGLDDLLIGAPTWVVDGETVGAAQVRTFDGNAFVHELALVTPCDDAACTNDENWHWFGWSLAAGDFDGDGHPDLAVGWPGKNPQPETGTVEIFETDGAGTVIDNRAVSCGSGPNRFGYAMVSGDVDSDGVDDLVVGAPYQTQVGGPNLSGAAFVLYDGLIQRQTLTPMDYPDMADKQRFGNAVSLGNYLGGGTDLVVGAKRAKDGNIRGGGAYTYGNVNGVMVTSQKLGITDFAGEPALAGAHFGGALSF